MYRYRFHNLCCLNLGWVKIKNLHVELCVCNKWEHRKQLSFAWRWWFRAECFLHKSWGLEKQKRIFINKNLERKICIKQWTGGESTYFKQVFQTSCCKRESKVTSTCTCETPFSHCPTHQFPKEIWSISAEKEEKVEVVFVFYNLEPFMYKTFILVSFEVC